MRILVAFGDDYRTYRDVIAAGISILRPRVEVETASLETLGERIEHYGPELVICCGHEVAHSGGVPAWVELSIDPTRPTRVCVSGRYSERTNLTREVLLEVIDEVEELIRTSNISRDC